MVRFRAFTWTTSFSFREAGSKSLVLRKSLLINGVAPDTVRNTSKSFRETDFSTVKPVRYLRERKIHLVFGIVTSTISVLSSQSVHSG
ncbi:hypothetical protein TNIN_50811 [Trichonephila inaurata madagascariensis]|uniref:Uncharacterized protein n=1 Tax=Trichonephila inaurata madagascariensis TaxID=2747483 RepID=A0A8X6MJJ9_9ARAC|nr:hypothetical protein TNIN_50811 [Trichonephila inaurata madagascariensis]